jgi:hypothetical protein
VSGAVIIQQFLLRMIPILTGIASKCTSWPSSSTEISSRWAWHLGPVRLSFWPDMFVKFLTGGLRLNHHPQGIPPLTRFQKI